MQKNFSVKINAVQLQCIDTEDTFLSGFSPSQYIHALMILN